MLYWGHIGIGFICVSPIYILMRAIGVELSTSVVVTIVGACLAWLPDLDMSLGLKHRGITHTIPCGFVVAFIASIFFWTSFLTGFFAFFSVFIAFVVHIFGDMFNIVKIRIFFPFSNKKYGGWKKFKSADKKANEYSFTIGIIVYVLALAFF